MCCCEDWLIKQMSTTQHQHSNVSLERHWHSNVPLEPAQYAPEHHLTSKDFTSGGGTWPEMSLRLIQAKQTNDGGWLDLSKGFSANAHCFTHAHIQRLTWTKSSNCYKFTLKCFWDFFLTFLTFWMLIWNWNLNAILDRNKNASCVLWNSIEKYHIPCGGRGLQPVEAHQRSSAAYTLQRAGCHLPSSCDELSDDSSTHEPLCCRRNWLTADFTI